MENAVNIYPNPFAYNEIEQTVCKTFLSQRDASYKKPQETIYQGNGLLAYKDNYEAPYPQMAMVDGFKPKEEIKE